MIVDDRIVLIMIASILGGLLLISATYNLFSAMIKNWNKENEKSVSSSPKDKKCFICGYEFKDRIEELHFYPEDSTDCKPICRLCNDMFFNFKNKDIEFHPFDYTLHRLVMRNFENLYQYDEIFFRKFQFAWFTVKQYQLDQTKKDKELVTRYISYLNNQINHLTGTYVKLRSKQTELALYNAMSNFCNELNSKTYISSSLRKIYGDRCCECGKKDKEEVIMYYRNENGENAVYCRECVVKLASNGKVFKHISDPRMFLYRDTMYKHLKQFIS